MPQWYFSAKGQPSAFEKEKKLYSVKGKFIGTLNDQNKVYSSQGYQGEIALRDRFLFHSRTGNYAKAARTAASSKVKVSPPSKPPSKAAIAMPSGFRDVIVDEA